MSPKKAVVLALLTLPLAACVSSTDYRDDGYNRNSGYGYGGVYGHSGHDHDRDRDRDHDRNRPRQEPLANTVDAVQDQQRRQIQAGTRSGEITTSEQRRLELEQKTIRNQEAAARADGRVTEAERRDLRRAQTEAARNIYREGNDAQDVNPRRRD